MSQLNKNWQCMLPYQTMSGWIEHETLPPELGTGFVVVAQLLAKILTPWCRIPSISGASNGFLSDYSWCLLYIMWRYIHLNIIFEYNIDVTFCIIAWAQVTGTQCLQSHQCYLLPAGRETSAEVQPAERFCRVQAADQFYCCCCSAVTVLYWHL